MSEIKKGAAGKEIFYVLAAGVFFSISWMLSAENSFGTGDFAAIWQAESTSYADIFSFLPRTWYNDRCIEEMLIKHLYELFGMNIQAYHIVFGIIHGVNTFFVYKILKRYILKEECGAGCCACVGAAVFGIYPPGLAAVGSVAAGAEPLGTLFMLLCIFFYLKYRNEPLYQKLYGLLSVLCFYLAYRTKETAIVLPLKGLLYELSEGFPKKKIKLSAVVCGSMALAIFFIAVLGLGASASELKDFSIAHIPNNIWSCLMLYFDWSGSAGRAGVLFAAGILLYSLFWLIKRKKTALFVSQLMSVISAAPMLLSANVPENTQLYIPSVFAAVSVGIFVQELLGERMACKEQGNIIAVMIMAGLVLVNYAPGIIENKNIAFWKVEQNAQDVRMLLKLDDLPKECRVYICDTDGNALAGEREEKIRLLLQGKNARIMLTDGLPDEPETPYVLWEWADGCFTELYRDEALPAVVVTNVSLMPFVKGGDADIAVTCREYSSEMSICVGGQELPTVMGEEFISATIPAKMLLEDEIVVQVVDTQKQRISKEYRISCVEQS